MLSSKIKLEARFAKNFILNKMGKNRIFYSVFYITSRCNLRCKFCDVWRRKESDMSTEQAKEVIDQLHEEGTCVINYSGGEPLLRDDIFYLAKYARKKGIFNSLSTNGTLISNEIAESIERNFDVVTISIDGIGKIHDRLRGVEKTYERALLGIENLIAVKNECKVGLAQVVTKCNQKEIYSIFKLAKNVGVDFVVYQPITTELKEFFPDPNYCIREILKLKRKNPSFIPTPESFVQLFSDFYTGKTPKICDASKLYVAISSDGHLHPCGVIREKVGCILNNKLKEVIVSGKNKKIIENCKGCLSGCTTEISLIFRNTSIRTLKNFFTV